jgi:hypothetical protein
MEQPNYAASGDVSKISFICLVEGGELANGGEKGGGVRSFTWIGLYILLSET